MTYTPKDTTGDQLTVKEWLAIRKEAGKKIDPQTAEVIWYYCQTLDPYSVDPDLPEEFYQIGLGYFAHSPDSDIWVSFYDLPEATCTALWESIRRGDHDDDGLDDLAVGIPGHIHAQLHLASTTGCVTMPSRGRTDCNVRTADWQP